MRYFLLLILLLLAMPCMAKDAPSRTPDDGVPVSPGKAKPRSAAESDFLEARQAFQNGDSATLERLYPRLANTLYEPYVAYYRLHMHLDTADAATIRQFLARPDDTPLIDRLRGEWLKQLANKQQWDTFSAEYPHLQRGDAELLCDALQARQQVQPRGALIEAQRLWMTGEAQPEDCMTVFDAALSGGVVTEDDVWLNIRRALEQGNIPVVRLFSAKLPARRGFPAAALDRAYSNPGRYLSIVNLADGGRGDRLLALFALRRLARQSPDAALSRWKSLSSNFSDEEQRYFFGWLGYEAARSQDPRALAWFRQAGDTPLNYDQSAWRVRAALRQESWREVLDGIGNMGPDQQQEKAWRYWKARAMDVLGMHDQAQSIFSDLSNSDGYYGQLAADEMDKTPDFKPMRFELQQADMNEVLGRIGIQRALALYRLNLNTEAAREWAWATRGFNDRQLLAASEVAASNGIYDRSIDAAERTQQLHDFSLRFPVPYRTQLSEHVRDNDLDEAWVYGLMRQESRFTVRANSNVGAVGLMQIMPATARWVARKMGLKNYHRSLMSDLSTNLKLGTYYLKSVLTRLDNNPVLASAAYNAGPNRAQQWRAARPMEGAIYIETIPFDETRDYVKKVMSNATYYSRLFGHPAASLKKRLGVISPKTNATPSHSSNVR